MALPWFKVATDLPDHPKLALLQRVLPVGVSALEIVVRLWAWTARFYPSGAIPAGALDGLPSVTRYVTQMRETGWLNEETPEGAIFVHNWDVRNGALAVAQRKNAKRQQKFRKRNALRNAEVVALRNAVRGEERRSEETRSEKTKATKQQKLREGVATLPGLAPLNGHDVGATKRVASPTLPTWAAYSEAYRQRYGVEPKRNASVNGQLGQLVKRLGAEEAPPVAAFYVGHAGAYYATQGHSVRALLRDAEKLHTEWKTGRQITGTQARLEERTHANSEGWSELLREKPA